MKGEVLLEALEVKCIIGILSHERATPQRLLLDVVMNLPPAVTRGDQRPVAERFWSGR